MSDKLGKPRFDFDFEPFESGVYTLKAKEVDIVKVVEEKELESPEDRPFGVRPPKGPKNDFNYVIQFVAEGGEMDSRIHFERFQHITQGHIGLKKLEGCMIKMEAMKPSNDPQGHDAALFDTEDFKKRFKLQVPGRKIVAIIKKKPGRTGGEFSNIVAFYHVNEYKQAQEDFAKKFKKGEAKGAEKEKEVGPLPGADQQGVGQVGIGPASDW